MISAPAHDVSAQKLPGIPRAAPASKIAWTQVVVASVLMVATLPGRTHGLGLITEPLLADLKLQRVGYANLNLWATVLGAAFCFPAGAILDRAGVRWTSAALCVALAAVVWRIGHFTGSVAALFALLLATRALGQSALSVASITAVGKATTERTGIAMGAFAVLLSLGFAIAFGLIGYSVREHGWRAAWKQVAVGVAVVAPVALLLLRDRQPKAKEGGDISEKGFSLSAALKTPAFWVFASAASLFNLVSSGLGFFNEAVLAEHGFDQKTFHTFLIATTLLSLVGQILSGWLSGRWTLRRLTIFSLVFYAIGLTALPFLRTALHLWCAALLIGVAGGMIIVIFFTVWPVAFGRAHLGRIQGAAQVCTVISSALGPILLAKSFEATRSYTPAIALLSALVIVNAFAVWRVALPQISTPSA